MRTGAALLALLCLGLVGCQTVEPWERRVLAQEQMAPDPHPLVRAQREHVYSTREAATGGDLLKGGGGCGCY